jgi:hypothetical protein
MTRSSVLAVVSVAPCQSSTSGGHQTTSPTCITCFSSPRSCTQPVPDVTTSIWPAGKGRAQDACRQTKEKDHDPQRNLHPAQGVTIPKLGLGTWMIDDDVAEAVRKAVELGYRHIDTAQAYGNERGVGEGVRSCGVPRDQIFVTTKLEAGIKSCD